MDWTVYWFQSIACFAFASVAMFSGISGAALMFPWFIMGFALLGLPEISIEQAIAASIFLESSAFCIGIYLYWRRGYIHWPTVRKLVVFVVPSAVVGAFLAHRAPELALRAVYSLLMLGVAWLLFKRVRKDMKQKDNSRQSRASTSSGLQLRGAGLHQILSGCGAFLTGLISTGIGEVTQPSLIVRSRYPVPIAAATSIVLVAAANISAVSIHFSQLIAAEGISAIPWNLVVWGVPGMVAGASVGAWLQGRVNELAARKFFIGLFLLLAVSFLAYSLGELAL
ncbi:MAG: sulfite exporter TauE/SafE family protein [Haliea sp.]